MPKPFIQSQSTGRRGAAVAGVLIRPGSGAVTVNSQPIDDYLLSATHRMVITAPLRLVDKDKAYDVDAGVRGGEAFGQAGALRLRIARALAELDPERLIPPQRVGFQTRDPRDKECNMCGPKRRREALQCSKR